MLKPLTRLYHPLFSSFSIAVIGEYLTKNKTTVEICDSGFNDL